MFEKIKEKLLKIEKKGIEREKKDDLEKILSTIKEIKNEIEKLEEKTVQLLENAENSDQDKNARSTSSFISRLKSARVNIETLLDRGWNLIVRGKYDDAIKELSRARKMDEENTRVYNLLGWAYIHLEKFDESAVHFQKVLNLEPDNDMAQANLGYINYKKGLYGEAIERLSNIKNRAKDKQAVLYATYYLGLVYYDRGMYEDAIEFLNKAVELGPNLYEAYYYLGKSYFKRGMKNLGKQIWERLIDLNKYNIWSQKAREELNGQ